MTIDRRALITSSRSLILVAAVIGGMAVNAAAHHPAAAAAAPPTPEVGTIAPDFTVPGATRYGLLRDPVRLSSFRGQTVVLAFFFKARTKG